MTTQHDKAKRLMWTILTADLLVIPIFVCIVCSSPAKMQRTEKPQSVFHVVQTEEAPTKQPSQIEFFIGPPPGIEYDDRISLDPAEGDTPPAPIAND